MPQDEASVIRIVVDGQVVTVRNDAMTLLDVLREAGATSVKDGCAPQGQCGCCTVLVDGAPRVSCVTPVRRMDGRKIVTVDGFDPARRNEWAHAFVETGGSQCGFCTPGIICRLEGLAAKGGDLSDKAAVDRALQAHLCRCTGWTTIREAAVTIAGSTSHDELRDFEAASVRAGIEGRAPQHVGLHVAMGRGGFADDIAPADALVAVPGGDGWVVGESLFEARALAGKIQGRRTTLDHIPPIEVAPGDWVVTLQTGWVEPAYLEPDAAWCVPGGEPVGPLLNGGAFGGKLNSPLRALARELADTNGRAVRVVADREYLAKHGPKRPPMAIGLYADGSGIVRVARTIGIADIIRRASPSLTVEEVDVRGPPTTAATRAAGWAEVEVALAALRGSTREIVSRDGGTAIAEISDGAVRVSVTGGDVLDEVVLRSYVIGAAHMALGWVRSESIAVDDQGDVHDLTIRSFGVLRAVDTPTITVDIGHSSGPSVNASDAAFVAVAAAAYLEASCPGAIPTNT